MSNVMRELFHDLEENQVRYLHFKSNTNLKSSFDGRGDFDVLIDPARVQDVERIITQHNGKRFNPPRLGRYPGVDNWLIFDSESGVLYHLHLHYQLATGKALIKDYVIPWRELLFETRIKDTVYDIYITDPNLELLMLLVRTVVKSTFRQRFLSRLNAFKMYPSMKDELLDLKRKSSLVDLLAFARKCGFSDNNVELFSRIYQNEQVSSNDFMRLSAAVRRNLRLHRRMTGCSAALLSSYYSGRRKMCSVLKNHSDKCYMIKKVHDTNGLIVAFVGVDGAGKSTVTKEIYKWLNKKIECKRFYMGSGDGRVPLPMKLLNIFKKRKSRSSGNGSSTNKAVKIQTVSKFRQPVKYIRRMLKMRALYAVQKNNCKKILTMQKYRLNGGISLLDRYPQIELSGMNDGPKIIEFRETFVQKAGIDHLIQNERDKLSIVKDIKPDVIFRLNISAETSMARKPEQKNIELFRRKIEDLNRITFQNARIIDINAEQPYEHELLEIKRILWSLM